MIVKTLNVTKHVKRKLSPTCFIDSILAVYTVEAVVSSHHGLTKKRVSQWRLSTRCHKSVTVWFASFSNPDSTAALALPQTPQTNS